VRFEPVADGTRVVLVHSGWDARPGSDDVRSAYEAGWAPVLDRYAAVTRA
jgi:hypothetical protein